MLDPIGVEAGFGPDNVANRYVESPPEVEVARDIIKRAAWVAPALIVVFGLVWGVHGALSCVYGLGLVVLNFALAALFMSRAARISPTLVMIAAMGGFFLRMAIIVTAVLLVQGASWVALPALLTTILVTHVGLLLWETRYVSASLAYPGLKPDARKGA